MSVKHPNGVGQITLPQNCAHLPHDDIPDLGPRGRSCVPGSSYRTTSVTDSGDLDYQQWIHYGLFPRLQRAALPGTRLSLSLGYWRPVRAQRRSNQTINDYVCRPYKNGTTTETCQVDEAGVFYVSIYGYANSWWGTDTEFALSVEYSLPGAVCGNNTQEGQEFCDGNTIDCATLDSSFIIGSASCICDDFIVDACNLSVAPSKHQLNNRKEPPN